MNVKWYTKEYFRAHITHKWRIVCKSLESDIQIKR